MGTRTRRTITYLDLEELFKSGMTITLKNGSHPKQLRGWYDATTNEARIYRPAHKISRDITETILHECVHAKCDEIFAAEKVTIRQECKAADEIAKKTLRKRPDIGNFIKQLWGIEY